MPIRRKRDSKSESKNEAARQEAVRLPSRRPPKEKPTVEPVVAGKPDSFPTEALEAGWRPDVRVGRLLVRHDPEGISLTTDGSDPVKNLSPAEARGLAKALNIAADDAE